MHNNRPIRTRIIDSMSFDPWFNLAYEEQLIEEVKENEIILYLWQNQKTVVIGCNQNPWKEVKCRELEEEGGKLARRLSGGGAVFHDLGNLNFTFVMGKKLYDLNRQLQVILNGVKNLKINARFSGRNDLVVNDKKFSGNAFYHGKESSYHHGTILVDVDMYMLQKYLNVSFEKIKSKGIDSVKSRVINLKTLNSNITIKLVKEKLIDSFISIYGGNKNKILLAENTKINYGLYEKYSSWDYKYGRTPKFDVELERRFSWGNIDIGFKVKNAVIEEAIIYSDAIDSRFIESLRIAFQRSSFSRASLVNNLKLIKTTPDNIDKINDIEQWINKLNI